MRTMLAVLVVACLASTVTAQSNTPKLEVGKVYAVVLSCTKQFVPVDGGVAPVSDCYIEYWRVLGVGKNGWVRFTEANRDSGTVWWGNTDRALAITEAEQKPAAKPAEIQA